MGNFSSNHSEYSNKETPNINIKIKNMLKANASSEDSEEDSGEESENDKEDWQIWKSREKWTWSEIQIESSKKKRNKKFKVKNNKKENINEHKKIKDSENNEVDPIKNKELGTIKIKWYLSLEWRNLN